MKKLILTWLLLLLPGFAVAGAELIAPKRVHDLIREGSGLWLIDVRSEALFNSSHIEGAINVPLLELSSKRLPENKILVLVDNSLGEDMARRAATRLPAVNSKVFVLAGGVRGWQREGLPLVGQGHGLELARVFPNELAAARRNGIPVDVFDLRSDEERKQSPLAGPATVLKGDFTSRLDQVLKRLRPSAKRGMGQIEAPVPTLLVLPIEISAAELYQNRLWNVPGDVRVLEGAYLAKAVSEKRTTHSGGCLTCPGN